MKLKKISTENGKIRKEQRGRRIHAKKVCGLALLLTLLLASFSLLAACGSTSEDETDAASATDAANVADSEAEADTGETEAEAGDESGEASEESGEDSTEADAADGEAETSAVEEITEAETTTRTAEEVGVETLSGDTAVIDGYEVSLYLPLPEGWEAYDLDGETIYVSEDYPLELPNISIYAAENDGSLAYTTQEIIEEVCEETFADMSFTMGEFENTMVSGYDAVIYSYSIVTGETEITQYYVLVETEFTLFRITFTDSGDACADTYQACIEGIMIF